MNTLGLVVVLGAVLAPLGAETVTWRAVGEVTEVEAAGGEGFGALGILSGQAVEVEWSYSDAAIGIGIDGILPLWERLDYRMGIELAVTVRIGDHRWSGTVASGAEGGGLTMSVVDVLRYFGVEESLEARLSSLDGASFSQFPGASATGINLLVIRLEDSVDPYDFLRTTALPGAMDVLLGEITMATATVVAGDERIVFAINPASVVVADGPAGEAVVPAISVEAGGVTLGWSAEIGAVYTIRSSGNGRQWGVLATVTADAVEESYTFTPSGGSAARLYQVSKDD